ncbi:SPW repeat protein [soil metagenome]
MKFLPTKIHGILDYLVGIALIAAPTIFGFRDVGGPAVLIPTVIGIVLIAYSIFTNYEWGVIKKVPMGYHLMVDYLASGFLAISPFMFGFADQGLNVWLPHTVVGLTVIAVVMVSKPGIAVPGADKYSLATP